MQKALTAAGQLVPSDHVLAETWLLLRHRLSRAAAEGFWAELRQGVARVEPVGAPDLEADFAVYRFGRRRARSFRVAP